MNEATGSREVGYLEIAEQVQKLFLEYGDTHKGFTYPKSNGFRARQRALIEVMRLDEKKPLRPRVLDIGCASGLLLDFHDPERDGLIDYLGVDLLESMVETARTKYPDRTFIHADPFQSQDVWKGGFDYVLMGGLFMWRSKVERTEFQTYTNKLLRLAFDHCRRGMAFNVMSKHVRWERDDLNHISFDEMAKYLEAHFTRNYAFRGDYGLFEYMTYVYK